MGRAGRLETTELVVKALSGAIAQASNAASGNDVDRAARLGLLFLVQGKDQYGVWYSTQATVNVLQALIAMASPEDIARRGALNIEVGVDGGKATSIEIPADAGGPLHFDLSAMLPEIANSPGNHRLSLRTDSRALLSASIVARESVPWREKDSAGASEDGGLRLRVSYDKTEAKQGEAVNCTVHAERVGSSGYGMMLAEIGLPPGVDVDMASLRRAPVSQFDVTPDRVVLYLWPQAGGARFSFAFRPRLKINALTQPSLLYDYYNPDARVSITPARFIVR